MRCIDEERLESDLSYRFDYLCEFIGFTSEDASRIQQFAPHLGPQIGALVDKTYTRLLMYDATARHFVPRQSGYGGVLPESQSDVTEQHPQIRFRKDHLNRYFLQLIGRPGGPKMAAYLDMVGKIHTPKAGSEEIDVPLIQMNALLGFVSDILTEFILESPLDRPTAAATVRAFNRLLWIQNDLISRHYTTAAACRASCSTAS